jgi:Flp pilus assembly pilin Flp
MRQILSTLWNDDCGSGLLTGEWLFLFGILVVGVVGGLVALQKAMSDQFSESAKAISTLKSDPNATNPGNGGNVPTTARSTASNAGAVPLN